MQPHTQQISFFTQESMRCLREAPRRLVAQDVLITTAHTVTIDSGPWTEGYLPPVSAMKR
jgi:hypothetical protein